MLFRSRQKEDAEYVDDIIKFISDKRYSMFFLDPSAASFKVAARRKGLKIKDAENEVLDGIRLVASLLALGKLKINRQKCPNIQKEFPGYIWDAKAAERGEEKPIKTSDHLLDALRYLCFSYKKVRV